MLCLRNLHRSFEHKSRKKELTVDVVANVYNLDGLNRRSYNDHKNFLFCMEGHERALERRIGKDGISLKNCIRNNHMSQSPNFNCMSYATFIKRYNSFEVIQPKPKLIKTTNNPTKLKLPKPQTLADPSLKNPTIASLSFMPDIDKESLKCMFCSKIQASTFILAKHTVKCQQRALKLRRQVMLQKVRSIIIKSKRPLNKKKPFVLPAKKKPMRDLPFKCDKCTDCFVSQQTLEMHRKYDHRPRPTCSICQKIFECRRKLLEHESVCNGEDKLFLKQSLGVVDVMCSNKVLTCNKCDNLFTTADRLREHKLLVNKRLAIPIEKTQNDAATSSTQKIFFKVCVKNAPEVKKKLVKFPKGENNCQHCGKEYQNEKRLLQHGPFCHVKNSIRRTRHTVKQNGKVHPKQHNRCKKCDINFETPKKLRKHNLLFHIRSAKPSKSDDFACKICQKTFATQLHYQKHFKLHKSPNICPLCTRFKHFQTSEFLQLHIKLFHKKKLCSLCQGVNKLDETHKCGSLSLKYKKKDEPITSKHKQKDRLAALKYKQRGRPVTLKPKEKIKPILSKYKQRGRPAKLNNKKRGRPAKHVEQVPAVHSKSVEKVGAPRHIKENATPYVNGIYTCHICSDTMSREIYLMEHMVTHTDLSPFECNECDRKFSDLTIFTSHLRMDHFEDALPYTLCSLKYLLRSKLDLKNCRDCGEFFLGSEAAEKHRNEKHYELFSNTVKFCSESNNASAVDFEEEIAISVFEFDDLHSTPIKSSGPPLERLLSASSPIPDDNTQADEHEYMSQEEAVKSLMLPLSLNCQDDDENETEEDDGSIVEPLGNVDVKVNISFLELPDIGDTSQDESTAAEETEDELSQFEPPIVDTTSPDNSIVAEETCDAQKKDNSQDLPVKHSTSPENSSAVKEAHRDDPKEDFDTLKNETSPLVLPDNDSNVAEKTTNNSKRKAKKKRKIFIPTNVIDQQNECDVKRDEMPDVPTILKDFPFRCDSCDINFLDEKMVHNHVEAVHGLKKTVTKVSPMVKPSKSHTLKRALPPPPQFIDLSMELFSRRPLIANKSQSQKSKKRLKKDNLTVQKSKKIVYTDLPDHQKSNNLIENDRPDHQKTKKVENDGSYQPKSNKPIINDCLQRIRNCKQPVIPRGFKTITREIEQVVSNNYHGNSDATRRSNRTNKNSRNDIITIDLVEGDDVRATSGGRKRKQVRPRCLKSRKKKVLDTGEEDESNNNNVVRKSIRSQQHQNNNTHKENNKLNKVDVSNGRPPPTLGTNGRFEDELFPPIPKASLPVNPAYFTAPKWDERSAFDLWNC